MNLIAIGDVHGRDTWKRVDVTADRIIFLGDYVDSRQGFSDAVILDNLNAVLYLKRKKPDTVTLLLGNHDAQYLHYPHYPCSGFRPQAQRALTALFRQHKALFQIACQHGPYLFTHAGLSNGWYQLRKQYLEQTATETGLADQLNAMHEHAGLAPMLFDIGPVRGGSDAFGGPVWADRSETKYEYLPGYHQVVGHTPVADITTFGDINGSITYCDVMATKADFYTIAL